MTADVFGLDPQTLARARAIAGPLYRYYFRVAACGAAIPASGPTLLVANHGGILPVDAALLCLDAWHRSGRVARPIVDHFVGALPFVGTLFARCGAVNHVRLVLATSRNARCAHKVHARSRGRDSLPRAAARTLSAW